MGYLISCEFTLFLISKATGHAGPFLLSHFKVFFSFDYDTCILSLSPNAKLSAVRNSGACTQMQRLAKDP
jgi:hypothetical protein